MAETKRTLIAIFRATAERLPDAEALSQNGRGMTYGELDRRSDAIAAALRARGLAPNEVIALDLPRCFEQLVMLLGILKAGGAVLPLDPAYPATLRGYMVRQSGAKVVIDRQFAEGAPKPEGSHVPASAEPPITAESLCYVLFTSGSTGRPKGVAMPHRAIANLVEWHRRELPPQPQARVLQFAPLSFDVSFQEVFTTWADGGTLVLMDDGVRRDPRLLWRLIESESIERVFLPYVALQMLAEQAPAELPARLREVITAGEALRITPQIRQLFVRMTGVRLHNHYGPTETHVCTAFSLPADAESWALLPSIGYPIDGVQISIIETEGAESGVGELCVGGACLADGYIGEPQLTAERFIEVGGLRAYRTGDLVRRSADGCLDFVGRADDQLKVRGYRVEPGEIEAQLSQHPAVKECAVTARRERLVAFWVGEAVPEGEFRDFLRERIAAHLVPSVFARVPEMPLTPSGKIDRKRLPELEKERQMEVADWPATLRGRIGAVWSEVLGLPVTDWGANFFDLGGTSLRAIAAQQLLEAKLQREIPVTLLFQYPTIEALARHLEAGATDGLAGRVSSRAALQRAAMSRRRRLPSEA